MNPAASHAVIIDRNSGKEYTPLQNLAPDQGRFLAYDSALSEYAALGFEYGYSVANPDALVLWKAQFEDAIDRLAPTSPATTPRTTDRTPWAAS